MVMDAYEEVRIYPDSRIEIVRKYQDDLDELLLELGIDFAP